MRKGFTLIELLVVIAIIAILAAILFPVFSKAREKARQAACMSNQKQIALSVNMYAQENEESLPPAAASWRADIGLGGSKIMLCKNESGAISYGFNESLIGSSLGAVQNGTTDVILTADSQADTMATFAALKKRHNNGAIASFLDGHVEYLKPAALNGITDPTDVADGAAHPFVLAGAGALYTYDGSTMVGSGVTKTVTEGTLQYFAVGITNKTAAISKTITSGLTDNKTTPATITSDYLVYAVTVPTAVAPAPVYTKMLIVPSGGVLAIAFTP